MPETALRRRKTLSQCSLTSMQRRNSRSTCWVRSTSVLSFLSFLIMKKIQEGYESIEREKINWGILGCLFVGCKGLCKDESCNCQLQDSSLHSPLQPTVAYALTSTDLWEMFNEWIYLGCSMNSLNVPNRTWQTSISSLLERHSKRLFARKEVGHWPNHSKEISASSKSSFCIPTRTCSRLGCGCLADHGCGTLPVPKETTQITSSSHNTNLTNHIHPTHQAIAILHWWDAACHCCSVNLLSMTHIACLPPYGTCCMVVKIWQKGHIWDNHGYDLLVSRIRWQ